MQDSKQGVMKRYTNLLLVTLLMAGHAMAQGTSLEKDGAKSSA
jgi:hypothetical protein